MSLFFKKLLIIFLLSLFIDSCYSQQNTSKKADFMLIDIVLDVKDCDQARLDKGEIQLSSSDGEVRNLQPDKNWEVRDVRLQCGTSYSLRILFDGCFKDVRKFENVCVDPKLQPVQIILKSNVIEH